jgi:hypothetical protein
MPGPVSSHSFQDILANRLSPNFELSILRISKSRKKVMPYRQLIVFPGTNMLDRSSSTLSDGYKSRISFLLSVENTVG